MKNETLITNLKIVLADTYALYLKTQNYHWHVKGKRFMSLHDMFQEQYEDLATAIDEIAERIVTIGAKSPATFNEFIEYKNIIDGNSDNSAENMVEELFNDQILISASLKRAMEAAQEIADEVTNDLMVGRLAIHEKNAWILKSSQ